MRSASPEGAIWIFRLKKGFFENFRKKQLQNKNHHAILNSHDENDADIHFSIYRVLLLYAIVPVCLYSVFKRSSGSGREARSVFFYRNRIPGSKFGMRFLFYSQ